MALDADQLDDLFKKLGKYLFLAQLGEPQADAYKAAFNALDDQDAGDSDLDRFDIDNDVVRPLRNKTAGVVKVLNGHVASVDAAIEALLRKYVAPDLGLAANSRLDEVGPALVASLTDAGHAFRPPGGNPDGFAAYFTGHFAIDLPTDAIETIPDSYITDEVL